MSTFAFEEDAADDLGALGDNGVAKCAETGASVAALVRQLHATMAQALAGATETGDPVEDELRTARERRRALAGG